MQHDAIATAWSARLGAPLPPEALRLLAALPEDAAAVLDEALRPAVPATRDPLTGLLTRPVLEEALRHEVASAQRHGPPSLLVADLDGLTGWMQSQGHLAGDLLVVRTADILRRSSRRSDVLGRLGVDQLALLLPRTDLPRGLAVARRVLARPRADAPAAERARAGSSAALPRLSVALGHLPEPGSVAELLAATDLALQRARRAGGGVVEATRPGDADAAGARIGAVGA
ncbi:MAG: GGDEF domain-containing protein [Mycobacteriales bacterium]